MTVDSIDYGCWEEFGNINQKILDDLASFFVDGLTDAAFKQLVEEMRLKCLSEPFWKYKPNPGRVGASIDYEDREITFEYCSGIDSNDPETYVKEFCEKYADEYYDTGEENWSIDDEYDYCTEIGICIGSQLRFELFDETDCYDYNASRSDFNVYDWLNSEDATPYDSIGRQWGRFVNETMME